MKKYYIYNVWKGIVCLCLFLSITGCEESIPLIPDSVNLKEELFKIGVKGFAIDSEYTEFGFYNNDRIDAIRKGVVTYNEDESVEAYSWDVNSPKIEYNGGSTITYTHNGLISKITRDNHGFISTMESKIGNTLYAIVEYKYHASGYLSSAILQRPGRVPEYITFVYPDQNGGVTIKEAGESYSISLQSNTENIGYVCNVFRYVNAPLTNAYVILADLYYFGLYGMPIKSLPNEVIRSGKNSASATILSRVGNYKFFYK